MPVNFEFKARHDNIQALEQLLMSYNPLFIGEDRQVDTYFMVPKGRLKLREGNIENALIYYERENSASAKQSDVLLYKHGRDNTLKEILTTTLGVKTVVDKTRRIYFVGNVKFHFDHVKELGTFVEVEAIDKEGNIGIEKLKEQCREFEILFKLERINYVAESYSDLLMAKKYSSPS